jgi:hypothetical protein
MWAGHFCRECVGNPIYASHAASRQLGSSKSTLGDGATACAYRRAQRLRPTALVEAGGMAERGRLEASRECMMSGVTVPPMAVAALFGDQ